MFDGQHRQRNQFICLFNPCFLRHYYLFTSSVAIDAHTFIRIFVPSVCTRWPVAADLFTQLANGKKSVSAVRPPRAFRVPAKRRATDRHWVCGGSRARVRGHGKGVIYILGCSFPRQPPSIIAALHRVLRPPEEGRKHCVANTPSLRPGYKCNACDVEWDRGPALLLVSPSCSDMINTYLPTPGPGPGKHIFFLLFRAVLSCTATDFVDLFVKCVRRSHIGSLCSGNPATRVK